MVIDRLESLIVKGSDGKAIAVRRSQDDVIDVLCFERDILKKKGKVGRKINYRTGGSRIFLYEETDKNYGFGSYSLMDEMLKEKDF